MLEKGEFMKRLSLITFIMLNIGICFAKVERNLSVELIDERIDGKLFTYRLDVASGTKAQNKRSEEWLIDGKAVEQEEYNKEIDSARLNELKAQREKEYAARLARHDFKQAQRIALNKKLIRNLIAQIEKKCTLFGKYELNEYIAYGPTTVASEIDFTNIPTHYLEPARQMLALGDEEFSFEQFNTLLTSLEEYPHKLDQLFEHTVKNAIERCDDTQRLKILLEVVS